MRGSDIFLRQKSQIFFKAICTELAILLDQLALHTKIRRNTKKVLHEYWSHNILSTYK